MTIDVNKNKVIYLGTGTVKEYDYDFTMPTNESCVVYKLFNVNSRIDLTEGVDYTLSETGIDVPAGTVTLTDFLEEDFRLVIYRSNNFLQEIDFANQRSYFLDKIEDSLDMLTIFTQQLFEEMGRSIQIAVTEEGPVILPEEDRANKVLGFDENGNPDYFVPTTYLQFATEEETVLGIVPDKAVSPNTLSRANLRVKSKAELRLYTGYSDTDKADVLGYFNPGDGAGGPQCTWLAGSGQVDDGGSVTVPGGIVGSVSTVGAWVWGVLESNLVSVDWFGEGVAAFNAALSYLVPGQKLISNKQIYTLDSSVIHSFGREQDGVEVELLSDFIFTATNGNGFDFTDLHRGKIQLGEVAYKSFTVDDPTASTGIGVTIRSCWTSIVDVGRTTNFLIGTDLVGGGLNDGAGNGMAFCKVYVRNAQGPKTAGGIGIRVTTELEGTTPGYFNENEIEAGFLRGETGVKFVEGSGQTDRFNGNKIYPQIESVSSIGLELNFTTSNTIFFPRFEGGSVPSLWWVLESADSSRNDYYITGSQDFDLFSLNGILQTVFGRLVTAVGSALANQLYGGDNSSGDDNDHDLYVATSRGVNTRNNTVYYGGIPGQTRWSRYAGGIRDGSGVDKVFGLLDPFGQSDHLGATGTIVIPLGISYIRLSTTGVGTVTLQMPVDRETDGYVMKLAVTTFTNPLEVAKSSGTVTIPVGNITSAGTYDLIYQSGQWKFVLIGLKPGP